MSADYDVLIVGGGMVGAGMALALSALPLRIAVIEAVPFRSASQPSYDDRAIALAYGSSRILDAMGLWPMLADQVSPIKNIHVSDRGHFGVTRISSEAEKVDALGYVIENRVMGAALSQVLPTLENVDLICPAKVTVLESGDECACLTIVTSDKSDSEERRLKAKLVVAADGGNSAVREMAGIETRLWQYGQSAVIANVTPERPHNGTAFERFTDSGPVALLPNAAADDPNRCSLVWTVRSDDEARVSALDDEAFLAELQQRFGYRLGRILKVGHRNAYPLSLVRAKENIKPRLALIGNAAHTLHPIAGQGYNLGLRDVAVLAQVIAEAQADNEDIGLEKVLARYDQWRKWDHKKVIGFTDTLARLFSNPLPPVALARNVGLFVTDVVPPLKRVLTRQTMGLAGRLPRLALGLPLVDKERGDCRG